MKKACVSNDQKAAAFANMRKRLNGIDERMRGKEFPIMMNITAHELCHGFDSNGANYNERGEFVDWWSIDDRIVFKKKQEQLISIFNQYFVAGTTFCNGAKTIVEDMADLGGMEIAYSTTVKKLEEKFTGEELLEMKRRFFKSYAIWFAKYTSLDKKLELLEVDTHPLNEFGSMELSTILMTGIGSLMLQRKQSSICPLSTEFISGNISAI